MALKEQCGDGNVLHPDCNSVNILVVMLCYSSGRGYHLGETGEKAHRISLHYFLQLHVSLQCSQNKKFNEKSKCGCHLDNNSQDTCNYGQSG